MKECHIALTLAWLAVFFLFAALRGLHLRQVRLCIPAWGPLTTIVGFFIAWLALMLLTGCVLGTIGLLAGATCLS